MALREEALIKEARQRARRRRQRYAAALATATAVLAVGAAFAMRPDRVGAQPSAAARPLAPVSSSATRSIIVFGAWRIAGDSLTGSLYTINPDGTGLRRLFRRAQARVADHSASSPALSPDGRKIAFQTGAGTASNRRTTATALACVRSPRWANTQFGRRMAPRSFSIRRTPSRSPTSRGGCVVRADGTNQHRLKPSGLYPAWSPDGSKIAYACGPFPDRYEASLCVMKANGTGLHRIALIGSLSTPAWSPDGSKIAFYSGDEWLYVVNANGTHLRQLKAVSSPFECTPPGHRTANASRSRIKTVPLVHHQRHLPDDADGRNIVHPKAQRRLA